MIGQPKIQPFYQSAAASINPPKCISVQKYAEKYFLSRYQVRKLVAKKKLCAVKFKRRLYIADIPHEER